MTKKVHVRLSDPEHARRLAEGVRRWQRNSIKQRCSIEKLAADLDSTVRQVKAVLKKPRTRLRRATERIAFRKAVKERAKKEMNLDRKLRRDNAAKIMRELKPSTISLRVAQMERKPTRAEVLKWRKALKDENAVAAVEFMRRLKLPPNHPDHIRQTIPVWVMR